MFSQVDFDRPKSKSPTGLVEGNLSVLLNHPGLTTTPDPDDQSIIDFFGSLRNHSPAELEAFALSLYGNELGVEQARSAFLGKVKDQVGFIVGRDHLRLDELEESMWRKQLNLLANIMVKNAPELPRSTSGSSTPNFQHSKTAPPQMPASNSTLNHGSRTVIKSKVGDVVGSTISNFGNNNSKTHEVYLREKPSAQLPASTSGVFTPTHGSKTEISSDFGDVVGSTISNIGNDNSNTDGLYLILSILILFPLIYYMAPNGSGFSHKV